MPIIILVVFLTLILQTKINKFNGNLLFNFLSLQFVVCEFRVYISEVAVACPLSGIPVTCHPLPVTVLQIWKHFGF